MDKAQRADFVGSTGGLIPEAEDAVPMSIIRVVRQAMSDG